MRPVHPCSSLRELGRQNGAAEQAGSGAYSSSGGLLAPWSWLTSGLGSPSLTGLSLGLPSEQVGGLVFMGVAAADVCSALRDPCRAVLALVCGDSLVGTGNSLVAVPSSPWRASRECRGTQAVRARGTCRPDSWRCRSGLGRPWLPGAAGPAQSDLPAPCSPLSGQSAPLLETERAGLPGCLPHRPS